MFSVKAITNQLKSVFIQQDDDKEAPAWVQCASEEMKLALVEKLKQEGNVLFSRKEYDEASMKYTQAIQVRCADQNIMAVLYFNRASARFYFETYGAALKDAERAVELKPDYLKAMWRAAQCAQELKESRKVVSYCDKILQKTNGDSKGDDLSIREAALKLRKETIERSRKLINVVVTLKKRGIKFEGIKEGDAITENHLTPFIPGLKNSPVHMDEDVAELLIWPVLFLIPTENELCFHERLPENVSLASFMSLHFPGILPTTISNRKKYCDIRNVIVRDKYGRAEIDINKTVQQIVNSKNFYVSGGALIFDVKLR